MLRGGDSTKSQLFVDPYAPSSPSVRRPRRPRGGGSANPLRRADNEEDSRGRGAAMEGEPPGSSCLHPEPSPPGPHRVVRPCGWGDGKDWTHQQRNSWSFSGTAPCSFGKRGPGTVVLFLYIDRCPPIHRRHCPTVEHRRPRPSGCRSRWPTEMCGEASSGKSRRRTGGRRQGPSNELFHG